MLDLRLKSRWHPDAKDPSRSDFSVEEIQSISNSILVSRLQPSLKTAMSCAKAGRKQKLPATSDGRSL